MAAHRRMLDANLNRLEEGLRVVEDAARFELGDAAAAARLKRLRHDAGDLRQRFGGLTAARDSLGDPGRRRIAEPARRPTFASVVGASFGRVQQSLRVIEELAKLEDAAAARRAKAMRYAAYDLEKQLMPRLARHAAAARLRGLYLILSRPVAGYEKLAELAVRRKVGAIQLRAKELESAELLALARRLRAITSGSSTLFFVNDRADIARLSEADGLHLGQRDLSVADARRIVGDRMLVGKSTHNRRGLTAALREAPDYVGIGPLFTTQSKEQPDPTLGIDGAARLLRGAGVPAVAIGGITAANLADVLAAGFRSYALIAAVCQAREPERVLRELRRRERQAGITA
ncbi:MAG TPA: thiamine phosphate synthase [Candidatus Sumerlaeota bacterium]|nr:thiamine phosphate synthase [Candidatus Sumerlaeota bacterium]